MSVNLHLGDAATVISERIPPGSVDMIYSDPPFGNEQIWTGKAGSFSDKWQWGAQSEAGWRALREHSPAGADLMAAVTPPGSAQAYIGMIAGLLVAAHAALRIGIDISSDALEAVRGRLERRTAQGDLFAVAA